MGIKAILEGTNKRTLQYCYYLNHKTLNFYRPLDVFLEVVNKIIELNTDYFYIVI